MITTINNFERVFWIHTSLGHSVFCNLRDLNEMVKALGCREGYFDIRELWNKKWHRVTKRDLPLLFESAGLKMEFVY